MSSCRKLERQNHPNQVNLLFFNKTVVKNRDIKKIKVMPPVGLIPASPGFEAKDLRDRMRKENCQKRL